MNNEDKHTINKKNNREDLTKKWRKAKIGLKI